MEWIVNVVFSPQFDFLVCYHMGWIVNVYNDVDFISQHQTLGAYLFCLTQRYISMFKEILVSGVRMNVSISEITYHTDHSMCRDYMQQILQQTG
jgi:hypothetical protein